MQSCQIYLLYSSLKQKNVVLEKSLKVLEFHYGTSVRTLKAVLL